MNKENEIFLTSKSSVEVGKKEQNTENFRMINSLPRVTEQIQEYFSTSSNTIESNGLVIVDQTSESVEITFDHSFLGLELGFSPSTQYKTQLIHVLQVPSSTGRAIPEEEEANETQRKLLKPGMFLTQVNGMDLSSFSYQETLEIIQTVGRPVKLQFTTLSPHKKTDELTTSSSSLPLLTMGRSHLDIAQVHPLVISRPPSVEKPSISSSSSTTTTVPLSGPTSTSSSPTTCSFSAEELFQVISISKQDPTLFFQFVERHHLLTDHHLTQATADGQLDFNGFRDSFGKTLLHYACHDGNLQVIRWLLFKGVHVQWKCTQKGRTCFHEVVSNAKRFNNDCQNPIDILQLLYDHDPLSIDLVDKNGVHLIHLAAIHGLLDIIQWWWTLGCNNKKIDLTSNSGRCIVHYASFNGHVDILEWTSEKTNILMDALDMNGSTPLHYACLGGHVEVVQWFLTKCPQEICLTKVNSDGKTPSQVTKNISLQKYLQVYTEVPDAPFQVRVRSNNKEDNFSLVVQWKYVHKTKCPLKYFDIQIGHVKKEDTTSVHIQQQQCVDTITSSSPLDLSSTGISNTTEVLNSLWTQFSTTTSELMKNLLTGMSSPDKDQTIRSSTTSSSTSSSSSSSSSTRTEQDHNNIEWMDLSGRTVGGTTGRWYVDASSREFRLCGLKCVEKEYTIRIRSVNRNGPSEFTSCYPLLFEMPTTTKVSTKVMGTLQLDIQEVRHLCKIPEYLLLSNATNEHDLQSGLEWQNTLLCLQKKRRVYTQVQVFDKEQQQDDYKICSDENIVHIVSTSIQQQVKKSGSGHVLGSWQHIRLLNGYLPLIQVKPTTQIKICFYVETSRSNNRFSANTKMDTLVGSVQLSLVETFVPPNDGSVKEKRNQWFSLTKSTTEEEEVRPSSSRKGQVYIKSVYTPLSDMDTKKVSRTTTNTTLPGTSCSIMGVDFFGFLLPSSISKDFFIDYIEKYQQCRHRQQKLYWSSSNNNCPLPSSSPLSCLPLLRTLCWEGIPPVYRLFCYLKASGALEKRQEYPKHHYQRQVARYIQQRRRRKRKKRKSLCSRLEEQAAAVLNQLQVDLKRTFVGHKSFVNTRQGQVTLEKILGAFAMHNPTIGYCQSMSFIAGRLLCLVYGYYYTGNKNTTIKTKKNKRKKKSTICLEESVFWLLTVLCEDIFEGYYTKTMQGLQQDGRLIEQLVHKRLPRVGKHVFEFLQVQDMGILIASHWCLPIFCIGFPTETCFRMLDIVFIHHRPGMLSLVLALLKHAQVDMLRSTRDYMQLFSLLKEKDATLFEVDTLMETAQQELTFVSTYFNN